jgi:hypothetical protein
MSRAFLAGLAQQSGGTLDQSGSALHHAKLNRYRLALIASNSP